MQQHHVQIIRLQPRQGLVQSIQDIGFRPGRALDPVHLAAAFGDQDIVFPPVANGLADHLFRAAVAGGGVDQVDALIKQVVQDRRNFPLFRLQKTDGRAAETQNGYFQAGLAKRTSLHSSLPL